MFTQNPKQDARQTSSDATMALVLMFKLDATAILIATTDLMKIIAVGFSTLALLYLLSFVLLIVMIAESKECGPDEFRCGDGSCIDVRARCNSYPECRDHSDEQNCGECMMF